MTERGNLTIRHAMVDDLDQVAAVWHLNAVSMDGAAPSIPSREQFRRRIDGELTAGWKLLVGERNGRIVGMLALKPSEAVLDQIFVLPYNQGSVSARRF